MSDTVDDWEDEKETLSEGVNSSVNEVLRDKDSERLGLVVTLKDVESDKETLSDCEREAESAESEVDRDTEVDADGVRERDGD